MQIMDLSTSDPGTHFKCIIARDQEVPGPGQLIKSESHGVLEVVASNPDEGVIEVVPHKLST
jgi:hypothetical protein